MPRFFFHVIDGSGVTDDEGTVLSGVAEARAQAVTTAGEILHDIGSRWQGEDWGMTVLDEAGDTVWQLKFSVRHP